MHMVPVMTARGTPTSIQLVNLSSGSLPLALVTITMTYSAIISAVDFCPHASIAICQSDYSLLSVAEIICAQLTLLSSAVA